MTDYTDIIKRLEEADGPCPVLNSQIMRLFYDFEKRNIGTLEEMEDGSEVPATDWVYIDRETNKWVSTHPFRFTASLDAAITLCERVLPGCQWVTGRGNVYENLPWAKVGDWYGTGASPAIALLLAIFRALQAQE